jgi:hypothetical protein
MVVFWVVGCGNLRSYKMDTNYVGFEVLTAANMKMAVFWVVASCSLVEVYIVTKLLPHYTVLQPRRQPSTNYVL